MLAASVCASAADRWNEYRSGPFRVVSNAGDKAARERLTEMEQLRFVLQGWIGKDAGKGELQSVWPITLVLFSTTKEYGPYAAGKPFLDGGSAVLSAWSAEIAQPLDWKRELVRRLLEDNAGRIPGVMEDGLTSLLGTLQANATRLTLGTPPPQDLRTRAWARLHYLTTTEEYAGRVRIYLNNLQQGSDDALAIRGSFNLSPADLEKRVENHVRAATFDTVAVPGKPLNPNRDFIEKPVPAAAIQTLLSELNTKNYPDNSPRAQLAQNTRPALELAANGNPKWAEPHFRLAALETNPLAKIKELKLATTLEPRRAAYWQALAEAQTAAEQHADATRSWASAEKAAATDEARETLRLTRRKAEERRTEFELDDRRRQQDERAQELERLKQASAAEIHAAEDAANRAQGGLTSGAKPVQWWTEAKGVAVTGTLQRVDCLATSLKLTITRATGGNVTVLVRDPQKIAVRNAEQATFACGSPRPAPKISIEHNGKADPAFSTIGDVLAVEFP
jgi:hypothetical protein